MIDAAFGTSVPICLPTFPVDQTLSVLTFGGYFLQINGLSAAANVVFVKTSLMEVVGTQFFN